MNRIVPAVFSLIAACAAAGKTTAARNSSGRDECAAPATDRSVAPGRRGPPARFSPPGTGTVTEGVPADLVLLDDDPLEDIASTRRIHGVMVRGHWLDRAELDRMLGRFRPDGPL